MDKKKTTKQTKQLNINSSNAIDRCESLNCIDVSFFSSHFLNIGLYRKKGNWSIFFSKQKEKDEFKIIINIDFKKNNIKGSKGPDGSEP